MNPSPPHANAPLPYSICSGWTHRLVLQIERNRSKDWDFVCRSPGGHRFDNNELMKELRKMCLRLPSDFGLALIGAVVRAARSCAQ